MHSLISGLYLPGVRKHVYGPSIIKQRPPLPNHHNYGGFGRKTFPGIEKRVQKMELCRDPPPKAHFDSV